jgi:hypothetical protein
MSPNKTNRNIRYTIIFLSILTWLKENRPTDYYNLEQLFNQLNIPYTVLLDMFDAISYYKSRRMAFNVLLKYYKEREEIIIKRRANELMMWSKCFLLKDV